MSVKLFHRDLWRVRKQLKLLLLSHCAYDARDRRGWVAEVFGDRVQLLHVGGLGDVREQTL